MPLPEGFSWIERPWLAALARPTREDLHWLRQHGIDMLLSLTEEPPPRRDVDDAGLLLYHVPVEDMTAPSHDDLLRAITALLKARQKKLGVAVHCEAGLGRTGTLLACWFVQQGLSPAEAVRKVRKLRPGSIETADQEDIVRRFTPIELSPGEGV
jgi:atypical dual specificity phosphatase